MKEKNVTNLDPFGGEDILNVLKFYIDVFPDKPVFAKAYEEIKRLREMLEKK